MYTDEKNIDSKLDLNPRPEEYPFSKIIVYLQNLSEYMMGIENLLSQVLKVYKSSADTNQHIEKSVLDKIEVKIDNLHRIFELADSNENSKIHLVNGHCSKRARKEDLKYRKEREMAKTLLTLKRNAIQK